MKNKTESMPIHTRPPHDTARRMKTAGKFPGALDTVVTPRLKTSVSLAGVARNASAAELMAAVRRAAEAATDFSWLSRGDAVLIKPVVNSGNPYPATTSPIGLYATVALLKEKGAGRVIVSDMAGIEHVKLSPGKMKGSTRRLMYSCGVAQAAQAARAELYFPEEDGWDAFFEDDLPVKDKNNGYTQYDKA